MLCNSNWIKIKRKNKNFKNKLIYKIKKITWNGNSGWEFVVESSFGWFSSIGDGVVLVVVLVSKIWSFNVELLLVASSEVVDIKVLLTTNNKKYKRIKIKLQISFVEGLVKGKICLILNSNEKKWNHTKI